MRKISNRLVAGAQSLAFALAAVSFIPAIAHADDAKQAPAPAPGGVPEAGKAAVDRYFTPQTVMSSGAVNVEGKAITYDTVAGTIIVHPEGYDDAAWRDKAAAGGDAAKEPLSPEASMFYVAYFKKGVPAASRPITFLFNGGPGSSTVWLHMGAFGPRRVVTADDSHTPAAPYSVIDNAYSLLDASDLVFIDAPGTGFSRIAGKDKERAFWGVDADAHAFDAFIKGFLTKHGRWNSPKFLFGESYGTPRAAVLSNLLQNDAIDLNGVILLSQILNFDLSIDTPSLNPGSDEAYIAGLPTYAATAWYHDRIPGGKPADLEGFLREVEHFATTDYAAALVAGNDLPDDRKRAIAEQLARYTGIPADYYVKANLRVEGGQFTQQLQLSSELTTGRLDTRFSGPAIDVFNKEADYDPQSAAISSAYVAAFNAYARDTLKFGADQAFKPEIDVSQYWDFNHKQPGLPFPIRGATNVMPDLALTMKVNPGLKVLVTGGYYDLATPYFEGWYEMHHMPIPASLQGNISFKYFPSGHMVYAHEPALKGLHDTVAEFIARNSGGR